MQPAIEVRNLHKHFGVLHAVNDISLEVQRGDVLGFLGPNGAGKSTTMKMITGFLEPSSGSIHVAGFDVLADPLEAKARLGYLPEGAPAYGEMTPIKFLNFIADVRGLAGDVRQQRIRDAIQKINLEPVLEQRIETLSKGFKRRVGLAQAILHEPEVLIMDEPTDGLDPNQKYEVRSLIRHMARDKAIVISTHILEEVEAVCTRAVIIAQGRIVFSGTPQELVSRSRYHNAVVVTVSRDDADDAQRVFTGLDGVHEVERSDVDGDRVRLDLVAKEGASIIATVSDVLRQQTWRISDMHVDTGRLDEVFRNVTIGSGTVDGSRLS